MTKREEDYHKSINAKRKFYVGSGLDYSGNKSPKIKSTMIFNGNVIECYSAYTLPKRSRVNFKLVHND